MARSNIRRAPGILLVLALASFLSGCVMSPRTAHSLGNVAVAALWTAAVVGQVALLAHHDAHYHYDHCGHYRRWHGERWVYYYDGRWEYYDSGDSSWYFYAD
ncbi:MAG TPA: hypothetical protein VNO33_11980 [Kofleriaceae bacterium]|nr:hypothetical protein [Kofleriaceae bacterium]